LPVVNTHIVSHHKAEHLHGLVSDIDRYPDFIKWIRAMRVTDERQVGRVKHMVGDAVVGFKGFNERFSTAVISDPEAMTVDVGLVRGPFRHLKNKWSFAVQVDGQTRVDFFLDYRFSNPVLTMLAAANSDIAVAKIMNAFLREADTRFPDVPAAHPVAPAAFKYVPFS